MERLRTRGMSIMISRKHTCQPFMWRWCSWASVLALLTLFCASGQVVTPRIDEPLLKNFPLRQIGPAVMGGRLDDIAVDEDRPSTFYLGAANGGIWKTTNNGTTWSPIFDDEGVAS